MWEDLIQIAAGSLKYSRLEQWVSGFVYAVVFSNGITQHNNYPNTEKLQIPIFFSSARFLPRGRMSNLPEAQRSRYVGRSSRGYNGSAFLLQREVGSYLRMLVALVLLSHPYLQYAPYADQLVSCMTLYGSYLMESADFNSARLCFSQAYNIHNIHVNQISPSVSHRYIFFFLY
jgi:hypothetical protein